MFGCGFAALRILRAIMKVLGTPIDSNWGWFWTAKREDSIGMVE